MSILRTVACGYTPQVPRALAARMAAPPLIDDFERMVMDAISEEAVKEGVVK